MVHGDKIKHGKKTEFQLRFYFHNIIRIKITQTSNSVVHGLIYIARRCWEKWTVISGNCPCKTRLHGSLAKMLLRKLTKAIFIFSCLGLCLWILTSLPRLNTFFLKFLTAPLFFHGLDGILV